MKIRDIGFSFGYGNWVADGQVCHQPFQAKAWPIMVLFQQGLKKAKIENDQINSIWFTPVQERALLDPQNRGGNLYIDVRIDWDIFSKLSDAKSVGALYCDLVEQGFDRIPASYNVPIEMLRDTVQDFRAADFTTKWTFKTRHFRAEKIKARLDCALDADNFELTLIVWKEGSEVFNDVILETYTDPAYSYYEYNDIQLIDGQVVVPRRQPKMIDGQPQDIPLFKWDLPA